MQISLANLGSLTSLLARLPLRFPGFRHSGVVARISALGGELERLSRDELRRRSLSLRYRALSGEPSSQLLPEAFALVREAADRALGMRPYDVQVLGAVAMHQGCVAEMQTGEGKTLAATMPLFLAAIEARGAHLATANDYLAARDAELMRPVFDLLGQRVAAIQASSSRAERRRAYACDVTYAAARELGFDFLRDRLLGGDAYERDNASSSMFSGKSQAAHAAPVQRELHFALVDEADCMLIDEARTPLIVSSLPGGSAARAEATYRWAAELAGSLDETTDFQHDIERRELSLLPRGRRKVREHRKPAEVCDLPAIDLYEHVERALRAQREFIRDRHYVVRDGQAIIVDEFTGRLALGRRWRDGIHQAIEAKEQLAISLKTAEAARINVQDFFLRYAKLAGMSGTAIDSRREFRRIYRLSVRVIPTNWPLRRARLPDQIFLSASDKWDAVVEEISAMLGTGRPVLVGTRSIDRSEQLSQRLQAAGIEHTVLNAHRHAEEALIVAQAGHRGRVTVATNMAGRGTDIRLADEVVALGGLHVICTEMHESARIDRQLVGRCARQGDPGSYRQFMSLDDELLDTGLSPKQTARLRRRLAARPAIPARVARTFRHAQARVERRHFQQRRLLLYVENERRKMQAEMGLDPFLDAVE